MKLLRVPGVRPLLPFVAKGVPRFEWRRSVCVALTLAPSLPLVACQRAPKSDHAPPTPAAAVLEPHKALAAEQPAAPKQREATAGQACGALNLPSGPGSTTRFAVVGDYGSDGAAEAAVARWIAAQKPEFVVTTGDNNYPNGEASTIDANIGQYFGRYICPYRGRYGAGATENRFFPSLGNHDWVTAGARPYLEYFTLPGNERYYEVRLGNVHLFVVDSDEHEPDGIDANSLQARWFQRAAKASDAPFKIFVFHHAPYSNGSHGPTQELRWPYGEWGGNLVLTGHDHHYERFEVDGVTYVVNGLGGRSIYPVHQASGTAKAAFNAQFGAQIIEATDTRLWSRFFTVTGELIDEFTLEKPAAGPAPGTAKPAAPKLPPH